MQFILIQQKEVFGNLILESDVLLFISKGTKKKNQEKEEHNLFWLVLFNSILMCLKKEKKN